MLVFTGLILLLSLHGSLATIKYELLQSNEVMYITYTPVYERESDSVYYADQFGEKAKICRYDAACSQTFCATITGEGYAAAIIPVEGCNHEFVVALQSSLAVVEWDGKSNTACVTERIYSFPSCDTNFMDSAVLDPVGRLYFGAYGARIIGAEADNVLYSYSRAEGVRKVYSGYKSCFGLAFSDTANKAYFLDSAGYKIYQFDWCRATGQLSNQAVFYTFNVIPGEITYLPYGLTIDSNDNLYVGSYGGGELYKLNQQGQKCKSVEKLRLPYALVGYPTFGGANYDVLYVTLSALKLDLLDGRSYPIQKCDQVRGSLIKITNTGWTGVPSPRIRLS